MTESISSKSKIQQLSVKSANRCIAVWLQQQNATDKQDNERALWVASSYKKLREFGYRSNTKFGKLSTGLLLLTGFPPCESCNNTIKEWFGDEVATAWLILRPNSQTYSARIITFINNVSKLPRDLAIATMFTKLVTIDRWLTINSDTATPDIDPNTVTLSRGYLENELLKFIQRLPPEEKAKFYLSQ